MYLSIGGQNIATGPEKHRQRHDRALSKGVDGGVGHLGKSLWETS